MAGAVYIAGAVLYLQNFDVSNYSGDFGLAEDVWTVLLIGLAVPAGFSILLSVCVGILVLKKTESRALIIAVSVAL